MTDLTLAPAPGRRAYSLALGFNFSATPEPGSPAAAMTAAEDAPEVAERLARDLQRVMRDAGFPDARVVVGNSAGWEVAP